MLEEKAWRKTWLLLEAMNEAIAASSAQRLLVEEAIATMPFLPSTVYNTGGNVRCNCVFGSTMTNVADSVNAVCVADEASAACGRHARRKSKTVVKNVLCDCAFYFRNGNIKESCMNTRITGENK